jgi:hypothetical protein
MLPAEGLTAVTALAHDFGDPFEALLDFALV